MRNRPAFFDYIRPHTKERLARVAQIMGAPESEVDIDKLSKMSIELIHRLQKSVDIDITLKDLGVEKSMLGRLAEDAMRTMGALVEVTPGNLKTKDLERILEMSY